MSEARKAAVFSCEYSEQNPVYCQQCGGHEHLCKKPLSDRWCEYANHLIVHGNDMTALSMRTNLLAEMNAHADHTAAIREKALALLAKLEQWDSEYEGIVSPLFVKERTALKAALEGNDEDTDA